MAKKISEFTSDTNLSGSEEILVNDGGSTKKISLDSIKSFATKGLGQTISASTDPVVQFSEYPVKGTIAKGQGCTLFNDEGTLKMTAITSSNTTVNYGATGFESRQILTNKTETDGGSNTVQVFENLFRSNFSGAYSQVLKLSDTKYVLIFSTGTRCYDSYGRDATSGKPNAPKRVYSESLTGSHVDTYVFAPFTVDSGKNVTFGDFTYFKPQAFKKISDATATYVDEQIYNFSTQAGAYSDVSFVHLGGDRILFSYKLSTTIYYPNSSSLENRTLPAGKVQIPDAYSNTVVSIVDLSDKSFSWCEYDNHMSNFFKFPDIIGGALTSGRYGYGLFTDKINSTRFVSLAMGYDPGNTTRTDDDGKTGLNSYSGFGGLMVISDLTEGDDTVGSDTIKTFTMSKVKSTTSTSTSGSASFNNVKVFGDYVFININQSTVVYKLNASKDDFIRGFDNTTKTFSEPSASLYNFTDRFGGYINNIYLFPNDIPLTLKESFNADIGKSIDKYSSFGVKSGSENIITAKHFTGLSITELREIADVDLYTSSTATDIFYNNSSSTSLDILGLHKVLIFELSNSAKNSAIGFIIKDFAGSEFSVENTNIDSFLGVAGADYADGETGKLFFTKRSSQLDLYSNLIVGNTYFINELGNLTGQSVTARKQNRPFGRAITSTTIALF